MKVAIIQPYFLPYIGYWQLLNSVDTFVVFDDVNYRNRSYIDRNFILKRESHSDPVRIGLSLHSKSQNKRICDLTIKDGKEDVCQKIQNRYQSAAHFEDVQRFLFGPIRNNENHLSTYLFDLISSISSALGIKTELLKSSEIEYVREGNGQSKIISICKTLGATQYLNAPGGVDLYDPLVFEAAGLNLSFLTPKIRQYKQDIEPFQERMSIVDVVAFCGIELAANSHL